MNNFNVEYHKVRDKTVINVAAALSEVFELGLSASNDTKALRQRINELESQLKVVLRQVQEAHDNLCVAQNRVSIGMSITEIKTYIWRAREDLREIDGIRETYP